MITITPRAAAQILESAQQQPDMKEINLRLAARLGEAGTIEYGMGFDERAEGDTRIEAGGIGILLAPGSVALLAGATLDYVEITPGELRYIFINPNDPSHKAPKPAQDG